LPFCGEKKMKGPAYMEFRERVEKALQGEEDGLTWDQLKKKGEIEQTRLCYTWARELENEIGLTRERRGRNVYWKLKKR
jgi:hypothetical protein